MTEDPTTSGPAPPDRPGAAGAARGGPDPAAGPHPPADTASGTGSSSAGSAGSGSGPGRDAAAGSAPAVAPPAAGDRGAARRRRVLVAAVATGAALVLLACFAGAGLLFWTVRRAEVEADRSHRADVRAREACAALENRLNRLTPPGAAGDPARRAAAIRDENAAARPFLDDLAAGRHPGRHRGARADRMEERPWVRAWRDLLQARTAYADALERQAGGGEPAFFLPPRTPRGVPAVEVLQRRSPAECRGVVRRLAQPDL
ncbi:MAG TPA: hypothetical protein VNV66_16205 [Pilimelia sp.]|nr:hypothetical protein [Pilimelia sp.]